MDRFVRSYYENSESKHALSGTQPVKLSRFALASKSDHPRQVIELAHGAHSFSVTLQPALIRVGCIFFGDAPCERNYMANRNNFGTYSVGRTRRPAPCPRPQKECANVRGIAIFPNQKFLAETTGVKTGSFPWSS